MYLLKPIEIDREKIKSILQELSEYYARPITDRQMVMYVDDLIDMGPDLTEKAAKQYRKYWNNSQFPLPALLRGAIKFTSRDLYVMQPRPRIDFSLISAEEAGSIE